MVEISKEEIPGSKLSMYGYISLPTLGFEGRTFQLCVLNRWEFNFCVCSFPLQGPYKVEPLITADSWQRGLNVSVASTMGLC